MTPFGRAQREGSTSAVSDTPVAASAIVPPTHFSFRADAVPIKQALALFARANHLNIVSDLDIQGEVTVEFQDLPLDIAMQALLDANGYYFVRDGNLLRVRNQQTRLFQIDYIQATRTGQGSNAVQISSGGGKNGATGSTGGSSGGSSSNTEGSSMTVTNNATINFWTDLSDQLKTMVSATGSYTINSLSGTVVVRDSHRNIETIAEFLGSVTANVVRQIDLEVEIYEVALNNAFQLGINWSNVSEQLDSTNISSIPGQLGLNDTGGLIVQTPVYGAPPGAAGIRVTHHRGNFSAVLDALKLQGNLKVVSKPRLRTLNNQPAVVRVGQDIPVFLRQVTLSGTQNPIPIETETIETITVGTVLSITPQISSDGLITLDITPAVSRLVRMETSVSGNNAPVIDIRQASSIVRVRDGATIIMGGLVQDSASTTHRKVPILGDLPLLGKVFTGTYENSERTELIFFLTPRIIRDAATEASASVAVNDVALARERMLSP